MATYYVDGAVGNDTNAGTSPGAGNAWATIGKAATTMVAGDSVNIKASATYTITTAITPTNSGSTTLPITYSGYTSSPGDGGQITVACSTNSVNMIDLHGQSFLIYQNFILSNSAGTPGNGVAATTANCNYITLDNFLISGCLNGTFFANVASGEFFASRVFIGNTEVKNCTGDGIRVCGTTKISSVYVHGCVNGVFIGNGDNNINSTVIIRSILSTNSGIGVKLNYNSVFYSLSLENCNIHNSTSDGINIPTTVAGAGIAILSIINNIIQSNGGWGINSASALSCYLNRNNAYRNNTSGNLNNVSAGTNDVLLSADPFVNAAGGNFSLNNTPGGGAACRGAAFSL